MTAPNIAAELKRLRRLLADYSGQEHRYAGMLEEIDALLEWALREVVRLGAGTREVEAAIGPPQKTVGEKSDPSFRWLYPSCCSAEETSRAPEWFFSLHFENGKLHAVTREGWSD